MIAHVPGTDRTTDVAVPRPRTSEPTTRPRTAPRAHAPTGDTDPLLVAARLEDTAAVLTWIGRLALLVAVGLVVLFVVS